MPRTRWCDPSRRCCNYLKNVVFLWGHKSGEPPIRPHDCDAHRDAPPPLVQKVEFADAAAYTFADTVFQLYKGKFLRAVSVGFMPLEHPRASRTPRTTRLPTSSRIRSCSNCRRSRSLRIPRRSPAWSEGIRRRRLAPRVLRRSAERRPRTGGDQRRHSQATGEVQALTGNQWFGGANPMPFTIISMS